MLHKLIGLHTLTILLLAAPLSCPGETAQEGANGSDESAAAGQAQEAYPQGEVHSRTSFGTNVDVVVRLNRSLPKTDSLFHLSLPESVSGFKHKLYDDYGLKLGASYSTLYQKASDSLTDVDSAWGGWIAIHGAWTLVNRGQSGKGKFVFALDDRHIINSSSHVAPGYFSEETGSLWPTDSAFLDWDLYPAVFFWEQWNKTDQFAFRFGQMGSLSALDSFRFDEFQSAFTNSSLAAPVTVLPIAAPGMALAAKWYPMEDSDMYLRGIVSDINAPTGEVDWSGIFDYGEVLAGGEIGYNWMRSEDDFDHAHLTLWYADEVSSADWESESGWGAKISGHKQWKHVVAFANYAYNTVEGGGLGKTNTRHALNAGLALLQPFRVRGEFAVGLSWGDPIDDRLRSQSGLEAYWKILATSNIWVTPGIQYIVNPTFNLDTDQILITQIKISLFL